MSSPKPSTFTERISSSFKEAMPRELTLDAFKKRSTQVTDQLSSAIKEGVPRELSMREFKKAVRTAVLIALITPGSFVGLGAAGTYLFNQFRQTQESNQDQPKGLSKERLKKEVEVLLPKLMGLSVAYGKGMERHEMEVDGRKMEVDVQFDQKGALIHAPVRIWDAMEGELVYEEDFKFLASQDECFVVYQ